MAKIDMKKAAVTGGWITAVVLILNFILEFMNIPVQEVFAITPATGITPTIGTKIIEILQNLVAFDITAIATLFVTAFAIVLVGAFVKDKIKALPQGKGSWQQLALTLAYGTAAFWLLLVGFKLPPLESLIGLAIYYLAIVITFGMLKKTTSKLI